MLFTDVHVLNKKAYDALKKIRQTKENSSIGSSSSSSSKVTHGLISENTGSLAKAKHNLVFNEFNESKFKQKVKFDGYVYNKLLQNLNESDREPVSAVINSMIEEVKNVYKIINIEPKIVGFKDLKLSDSNSELVTEAESIINNYINKHYYSLSTNEKRTRYKSAVTQTAKELVISENINPEEALSHAYKSLIVENFVRELNFPYIIKHKVKEIFDDELYNDFFDISQITEAMESFDSKAKSISRIIALTIL